MATRAQTITVALAVTPLLVAGGCTATPSESAAASASTAGTTSAVAPSCLAKATAMSRAQQAGQVVMVGVTGKLDSAEAAAIKKYRIGSVILMGNYTGGVAQVKKVTAAIRRVG